MYIFTTFENHTQTFSNYNEMRKGIKKFALKNKFTNMDFILFDSTKLAVSKMWNNTKTLAFTVKES